MNYYLKNKSTDEIIELFDGMTFGRRSSCDVVFKDDLVSGFHCRFHVGERLIFVEDLKASNVIQINGIGVAKSSKSKIKHHDLLTIGKEEYIFVDDVKDDDISYKSISFQKVKIHETFDSDKNYEENQKFWERESNQKKLVKSLKAKVDVAAQSKDIILKLKKEYKVLIQNQDKILEMVSTPEEYNLDELKEHIDVYNMKIEDLQTKKEELIGLYNSVVKYKDQSSKITTLKKRIIELEKKYSATEYEDLSREYKSAVTELKKLNELDKKKKAS